ncbi:NAD(P)-dependent oxidoreductase [Streptomyces sp. NPDC006649]|uniref:NAD-dependent epimerase/dehydratase family protein n=1 Tax=Streptomyces sp. NPDC006649 TaxID=3156896 RepID=UPI0033B5DF18
MTATRSVLVLGGTGFLGQHIGAAFTAAGDRVASAARSGPLRIDLATAAPRELAALLDRTRPDVVVNASGRAWRATGREMLEANAEAVGKLAAAVAVLPHRPRLVQLGSVHEYGPGTVGEGTREDQAPAPVTPYGRSKLLGSLAVLDAARTDDLNAIVLRLANVCGPGTPRGSLLGMIGERLAGGMRDSRDGAPAELRLAPLHARRDFVDVRDVVDAVLAAAELPAPAPADRVLNIGSGTAVPMRDLVGLMVTLSGLSIRIVEESGDGTPRTDVEWQQLDITKARRLLGWRPHRGAEESLRDLLAAESARPAEAA